MNIQSLSVCVPAQRCINDCKFCCSKMHATDYEDRFTDISDYDCYSQDMRNRMEYARENGCNTCMLTGNNEPQQNKDFLKIFSEINKSLLYPFLNIEMQTTGAFIDEAYLDFLKRAVGVTTIAVSIACLDDDDRNRALIQTPDGALTLARFCSQIRQRNINLRLCLNMNDEILVRQPFSVSSIISLCETYGANQITFRALWAPDNLTEQGKWIEQHVTRKTMQLIGSLKDGIHAEGKYLDTLEYGADRYDYHGFSVVLDDDSMSKKENKNAVKYLILRPDGHLYSKWDSKASLIF